MTHAADVAECVDELNAGWAPLRLDFVNDTCTNWKGSVFFMLVITIIGVKKKNSLRLLEDS